MSTICSYYKYLEKGSRLLSYPLSEFQIKIKLKQLYNFIEKIVLCKYSRLLFSLLFRKCIKNFLCLTGVNVEDSIIN